MKTAKLEILGVELPLGRLQEYHDEGFVNSLYERLAELSDYYKNHNWLLQLDFLKFSGQKIPPALICIFYTRWPFKTKHVHLLYEDQKSEIMNINCRAHEEAHAAYFFGIENLRFLEEAIRSNGFLLRTPSLSQLKSETIAKIGGLYALLQKGYSENEIKRNLPKYLTKELDLIERK